MKKVLNYLRSMRFGILLLALIALCSVAGTVIPQGREIAWYAQTYRSFHAAILVLGLHKIFQSWYFILLLVLLCLNLSLCSILRIRTVVRGAKDETARIAAAPDQHALDEAGQALLREHMAALRCREEKVGGASVWRRNGFGRYGTFLTHLSILLTVIFGAVALYTPTIEDRNIMPGETLTLSDGTRIRIDSFRLTDETGRLDYESMGEITLPDGSSSGVVPIRVNHPVSFGPYKLFQQSFGTAGSVTALPLRGSHPYHTDRGQLPQSHLSGAHHCRRGQHPGAGPARGIPGGAGPALCLQRPRRVPRHPHQARLAAGKRAAGGLLHADDPGPVSHLLL